MCHATRAQVFFSRNVCNFSCSESFIASYCNTVETHLLCITLVYELERSQNLIKVEKIKRSSNFAYRTIECSNSFSIRSWNNTRVKKTLRGFQSRKWPYLTFQWLNICHLMCTQILWSLYFCTYEITVPKNTFDCMADKNIVDICTQSTNN